MSTQNVLLDTSQYVQITSDYGSFLLQSHRDTVRIAFSDAKPAKSNTAFHELGGQAGIESVLDVSPIETFIWALAMTSSSKLTITETDGNIPVSIESPLEPNGSVPVTLQDQTTPIVIVPLHQMKSATTLATDAVIDTYSFDVTDVTNFTDGSLIIISDTDNSQVYFGKQIGAPSGNTINVDRPLDFTFVSGKYITTNNDDMAVDGSTSTQVFGLRRGVESDLNLTVDVTRVLPIIYTNTTPTLGDFGDISGGITHGVTLRKRDGNRVNIFNMKDNGDFASFAYDVEFLSAIGGGQDGVHGRLTFAGQSKMGAVVRVAPDEDLEMIINDNLSSLNKFILIAEGSIAIV